MGVKKHQETVTLELTYEEIGKLALRAHNEDMTLNQFIVKLLEDNINEMVHE